MSDFEQARIVMVDRQIRPNDVTDPRLIDAFLEVPREEFLPSNQRALAYMDEDIPLSSTDGNRYLMEPTALAKLIQLANIREDHIVLDVGCATGYSTAVLSEICGSVVALECDESLATQASETLSRLAFDNVAVVTGELSAGYPNEAPYDVIFVGGAVEYVPDQLVDQLKAGGRLIVVEGRGNTGLARVYIREGDAASGRTAFNSAVMPLPGFAKGAAFQF